MSRLRWPDSTNSVSDVPGTIQCDEVGPWRFFHECYMIPSQEWLFRAWKAGKDLRHVAHLTVITVPSGPRPQSYARRECHENRDLFEGIRTERDFRERILTAVVMNWATRTPKSFWSKAKHDLRSILRWGLARARGRRVRLKLKAPIPRTVARVLVALGCHPSSVWFFIAHGRRKGEHFRSSRRERGLPPI